MGITEEMLRDMFNEQRAVIQADNRQHLETVKEEYRQHLESVEEKNKQFLETVKEENKKFLETMKEENRHLLGIMKEDSDSKMRVICEKYGTIKKMLDSMAEDMQTVKTELHIKVNKDEHLALKKRVTVLETKVKA